MQNERERFLRAHEREIAPLTEDSAALKELDAGQPVARERVQALIEQFETKVFSYERADAAPEASRILLEASQPANFTIIELLLESLKQDAKCSGITLLADGVAGKKFAEKTDSSFAMAPTSDRPVFTDIPPGPYASALVIDESGNTPVPALLNSAKSVFGARKLYYLCLGLFGPRPAFDPRERGEADEIDAVLVPDEFVQHMAESVLGIPKEKLQVAGSPLVEKLQQENPDELRENGREKLAVGRDAIAVLYSGFPSADFESQGGDPALNVLSFDQTLAGMREAARTEPSKKFAFIVRTHPRSKNVEPPLSWEGDNPSNLQIVDGNSVSYEESVYAADIIACNILSTESLLARYRGREAAIFAYSGEGQQGAIVEGVYGDKGIDTIKESDRMTLIDSSATLADYLQHYQPRLALPIPPDCVSRVKEILLHQ